MSNAPKVRAYAKNGKVSEELANYGVYDHDQELVTVITARRLEGWTDHEIHTRYRRDTLGNME